MGRFVSTVLDGANSYLRHVGPIIVAFLLASVHKNFQTDVHAIFRKFWQWSNEQIIKFWWRIWIVKT